MAIQGNLQLEHGHKIRKKIRHYALHLRDKVGHTGSEGPVMLCFHDQHKYQLSDIEGGKAVAVVLALGVVLFDFISHFCLAPEIKPGEK